MIKPFLKPKHLTGTLTEELTLADWITTVAVIRLLGNMVGLM